jgi:superfamily I DNA/RNA helicase
MKERVAGSSPVVSTAARGLFQPAAISAEIEVRSTLGLHTCRPDPTVPKAGPTTSAIARESLSSLLAPLDTALGLAAVAAVSPERRDHTVFADLRQVEEDEGLTLEQLAGPELTLGKVALTTYHSAKGREFSVVILPGLVEGVVPRLSWSRRLRRFEEPARAVLAEER